MNGSFKGLKQSDVYLTSYTACKQWEVSGSSVENLGIDRLEVSPGSSVYESLKTGYYEGSLPEIGSFSGSFDLDLQSTLTLQGSRALPEETVIVYQIPRKLFGENIKVGTFRISDGSTTLVDREGLILSGSEGQQVVVGDIIYNRGLILLDKNKVNPDQETTVLSWTSKLTINTWNIKCEVKDLECNYSYNSSILGENKELMGTPEFTPYVTSIGLYSRTGELMAIAKLSKPIRKMDNIDTTFKVRLDIS